MTCTSGDRAIVWRVHPSRDSHGVGCIEKCIDRVIVQVTKPFHVFGGMCWEVAEPVMCPRNPNCTIIAFFDHELKPLPPEEDVKAADATQPKTITVNHPLFGEIDYVPFVFEPK